MSDTGRNTTNNFGRVIYSIANSGMCNALGCRSNIRHIRHMPTARARKHMRASTTDMTILPRTRRFSMIVGRNRVG